MELPKKLAIGIDVGGSGIKGAPVAIKNGKFTHERLRIPTPADGSPQEIAEIIAEIADSFALPGDVPVGVSFPAPIINGVVPTIANLSQEWTGLRIDELLTKTLHRPVTVINDADAAGYAEVHYGAAHRNPGTILVLTLGTGIGSALVRNGVLVPNTELGHIQLPNGLDAEEWAASSVFEREELSYEEWAQRLQVIFRYYEFLFSPDLFIIGGGISKKYKKFLPLIDT
ncbi:MAG: ROK family protein, partial [Arcanobacterium sp.]|nr:ROK family protein [Arcanobacterium sp.]